MLYFCTKPTGRKNISQTYFSFLFCRRSTYNMNEYMYRPSKPTLSIIPSLGLYFRGGVFHQNNCSVAEQTKKNRKFEKEIQLQALMRTCFSHFPHSPTSEAVIFLLFLLFLSLLPCKRRECFVNVEVSLKPTKMDNI